ncbi:MAG: hypothetical protein IT313_06440 [Anaerolineales bacterium]|nr:hypothetical protein [Anaerolineales bacterium]
MSQTKSSKPKSPPVPSYTLRDSLEDAKKLYKKYSHASFSKAEIASALNMSSGSSSFAKRLFALTEYGLIEGSGDSYKTTGRFSVLNSNKPESSTFKKNAFDAIQSSGVFLELLNEFKTKLPDQNAVAQRLETQKKFNAERAKEVASVLEKSLQFAGVLDGSNNVVPIRDGAANPSDNDQGGHGDESEDDHPPVASMRKSEIPLANERTAVVSYPHDLTKDEATKIGRVLSALVD